MKIARELKPDDLFTVAGPSRGMRWLWIDGVDAELTVTEDDADAISEFFASLAAEMRSDAKA